MKLVQIPDWLPKVPLMGKLFKPLASLNPSSKSDNEIMMKIVQEAKDLSAKDIQDWRDSLELCDSITNPRWHMYQDFLDYLEPDAQLGTSKDLRVAATLGKKYMVYSKKTGKEIPEKTALLMNKEWFFNFAWHHLDAVFKGYTVCQLTDPELMKFYYVPRRNVIPQKDMIVFSINGETGIRWTDRGVQNIIANKYKHNKGILNDIIPNLIWKKNARHAWSEFAEKFGIPMISATTSKTDKTSLDRIEKMLKLMGEAATAVLPQGTTVTIHDQATKGDPYNVFLKQIEMDDKAISKRLLGGTMLTDDGASHSQAQVHERNLTEGLAMFDKMMLMFIVNDQLLPLMAANGYPFTDDDAFKFDESKEISISDHWKIVSDASDKFEIPIQWISKTFNIPITAVKDRFNAAQNPNANFNKATKAMAASLVAKGITLPNYTAACCHRDPVMPSASFSTTLLEELSITLINDVFEGNDTLVTEILKSITSHRMLLDGLIEGWGDRRMQLTYDATDNHCLAAMEYNLFEFSRMKEKANVFALNDLLIDKETNNRRTFNDFRDQALPYLKNADQNWLKTEYNHSIAVGQNASRYHQFKGEEDSITQYVQWQTVGDSAVRPAHQLLEGKIFSLKDGTLSIWPPKDWGCRCEMIQYLGTPPKELRISNADALKLLNLKEGEKWVVNRAVSEEVFTANEMYLKQQGIAEEINKLSFKDYSLKPYDEIKKNYPAINLDKTITKKNVGELFIPEKGKNYMGFEDYLGRKMTLDKKTFTNHTTDEKYLKQNRHQLFAKVKDILSDPDEVYYFDYAKGRMQTKYVKFYNDAAVAVSTNLGSKNVQINSWFNMDNEKGTRRGYLIHKKNGSK